MNHSLEELKRIKSHYHLLSSDLCNPDPCNICKGNNIGIRGVTTPSDSFGPYGYCQMHTLRYCIPCTNRKTYPNLSLGETLEQHTHKWEARNGKYGGFCLCIVCRKTISASADEALFRRICKYSPEVLEKAISTSIKASSARRASYSLVINALGGDGYLDPFEEPGPLGGDGYNDPFFYGGDDGGW